jgi:hypothetical protein
MNEDAAQLRRDLANTRRLNQRVESMARQAAAHHGFTPPQPPQWFLVKQTAHPFTLVGQPIKRTAGAYALAQADTAANAQMVGVVGSIINANAFIIATGGLLNGLTGRTDGARYYLDATTAGGVTTTPPAIVAPVYDAISTTAAVIRLSGSGGGVLPTKTDDGWVLTTDPSGNPTWARDVDIGTSGANGVLRVKGTGAAGDAVVIDASLVPSAGRALSIRTISICVAGAAKSMDVLASAPY